MPFPSPLVRGRLIKRYKRFLADVLFDDGRELTVLCPNTGAMIGLTAPGSVIWLSHSDNAARKYAYTWELIEADLGAGPALVGINAHYPNRVVAAALAASKIGELGGFATLKREVKYGISSRIDILLSDAKKGLAYVEIKNVHLMRKRGLAEFPDCVTERGAKHLAELSAMAALGHRAVMVYLIQRGDAKRFAIASDLDPAYAAAFANARRHGVEALAYRCHMSVNSIEVDRAVPVV